MYLTIFFFHKLKEQELRKPHWNHKYCKTHSGENWALESTEYFHSWNIFILSVSNQLLNNLQFPVRHLVYFTDEGTKSQRYLGPNFTGL